MKQILRIICLIISMLLLLSGCSEPEPDTRIQVFIQEADGFTVENNGQLIVPGSDAVFTVTFDRGISLADTDYSGKTRTESSGKTITLTLEDVRYPTRVSLELTRQYAHITYHANGGDPLHTAEDTVTKSVSLSVHPRANTDTGTDMFARNGYTLLCWNTEPDGSGTRVGLGSRVSTPNGSIDLYAQWVQWTDPANFTYTVGETVTVTGYSGTDTLLVIPEYINGLEVTAIAAGAFENCAAETVVLPKSMDTVEPGAFKNCGLTSLVLFDNIISVSDSSFENCVNLQTLHINAIEAPYGYLYRKESCYADKVDMLINARGKQKLVFYGGCSMWFNLDGPMVLKELGDDYTVINMALNGTVNSAVQMQIMGALLEDGDILFHTPELSSSQQLLTNTAMLEADKHLWCGIENNYDMFLWVDLRTLEGVFDSLRIYLDTKAGRATYAQVYADDMGQTFMDKTGSVPFFRNSTEDQLGDRVFMDPERIKDDAMARLKRYYDWYQDMGVRIYVSYACINLDAVPEDQLDNAPALEEAFSAAIAAMDGPTLISQIEDFFFRHDDFYDTNYHLRTQQAQENTAIWLRDLTTQMEADGLLTCDAP